MVFIRKEKERFLILLLVVFVLGYLFYLQEENKAKIKVGDPVPEFTLPSYQDGSLSLSSLRGTVVLLNFWASWCPACIEEMPSLDRLHEKMKEWPFVIVAVAIDDDWPAIRRFLDRTPLHFKILLDKPGEVASAYGTYRLPETYLIDKNGLLLKKYVGPRKWDEASLVEEIQKEVLK